MVRLTWHRLIFMALMCFSLTVENLSDILYPTHGKHWNTSYRKIPKRLLKEPHTVERCVLSLLFSLFKSPLIIILNINFSNCVSYMWIAIGNFHRSHGPPRAGTSLQITGKQILYHVASPSSPLVPLVTYTSFRAPTVVCIHVYWQIRLTNCVNCRQEVVQFLSDLFLEWPLVDWNV